MHEKQRTQVSNLIRDAVAAGRIKRKDLDSASSKFAEYIPYWALTIRNVLTSLENGMSLKMTLKQIVSTFVGYSIKRSTPEGQRRSEKLHRKNASAVSVRGSTVPPCRRS